MNTKLEAMAMTSMKTGVPAVRSGDVVRIHQRVKEGDKERIQVFEGVVLARKHGKGVSATIMVRKVTQGVGVERIFPLHSPLIAKIEIVRRSKTKRAKLYFLRYAKGRKARLKAKEFNLETPEEKPAPVAEETEEAKEKQPVEKSTAEEKQE